MGNFPSSLPNAGSANTTDTLAAAGHTALHNTNADEIRALATKLGIGSSTPTADTWLKGTGAGISEWTSIAKSDVGLGNVDNTSDSTKNAATATLTNKTLTTPQIDTISEKTAANGVTVDGLKVKDGGLADSNGNGVIGVTGVSSAVNKITVENAVATEAPEVQATGSDTNIGVDIVPKGTGRVTKNGNNIDNWEEIGRTTLGSSGDTITLDSLPEKKYLRIVILGLPSGSINLRVRFNNDSGNNYANQYYTNGTDTSSASQAQLVASQTSASVQFATLDVINIAAQRKIVLFQSGNDAASGAASAPGTQVGSGEWDNTSDAITRVDVVNLSTGDFVSGSEVVVYGHN